MSSRGEVLPSFLPASGIELLNFYITSTFGKQLIQPVSFIVREGLLFLCRHYFNVFNVILCVGSCYTMALWLSESIENSTYI